MEILIIVGGCYALYTVGMAIATELDYRDYAEGDTDPILARCNSIDDKIDKAFGH